MHKNTPNIKQTINESFDDSYDRVRYLKDKYKGETAYILGTGPSLNSIPSFDFLKDKLVISMKQSIDRVPDTDYHLLNFCNLTQYNYQNPNTIVGWTVWDNNQPQAIIENWPVDFILPTFKLGDGSPKLENSVAFTNQWNALDIDNVLERPWGPGTMYELAIPLALYFGCTNIVALGWDLYGTEIGRFKDDKETLTQPHCYNNDDLIYKNTDTAITRKEIVKVIESTKPLYEWLQNRGVNLTIIDPLNNNPAYEGIPKQSNLV